MNMVYITLDELKEILPEILDQWIDDEGDWEWIFQEIEQKCHFGKRLKGKKWKKKLRDDIDKLQYFRDHDYEIKVNGIAIKVNQLNKEIEEMHKDLIDIRQITLNDLSNRIEQARSMAQTAKQRTEVDYTKCSKEKSDADVVQEIYNRMACRGATREELNTFRYIIKKYDACEKKEIPVDKKEINCRTCKYSYRYPHCFGCGDDFSKWEAKEEQSKSCINCKYYSDKNGVYACTCSNGICGVDNENWEAKDNG